MFSSHMTRVGYLYWLDPSAPTRMYTTKRARQSDTDKNCFCCCEACAAVCGQCRNRGCEIYRNRIRPTLYDDYIKALDYCQGLVAKCNYRELKDHIRQDIQSMMRSAPPPSSKGYIKIPYSIGQPGMQPIRACIKSYACAFGRHKTYINGLIREVKINDFILFIF
jgi:hypothetical protein